MTGVLWTLLGGAIAYGGVQLGIARERARKPAPPPPPPAPICGCEHELAMHDPQSNRCHEFNEVRKWDDGGAYVGLCRVQCSCRQYTGPRPIDQVFLP